MGHDMTAREFKYASALGLRFDSETPEMLRLMGSDMVRRVIALADKEMEQTVSALTRLFEACDELDRQASRARQPEGRLGTSIVRRLIGGETLDEIDY